MVRIVDLRRLGTLIIVFISVFLLDARLIKYLHIFYYINRIMKYVVDTRRVYTNIDHGHKTLYSL